MKLWMIASDTADPTRVAEARKVAKRGGHTVVSSGDLDETRKVRVPRAWQNNPEATAPTIALYLRRNLAAMLECQGVLLVDGWTHDARCTAELLVAKLADLDVYGVASTRNEDGSTTRKVEPVYAVPFVGLVEHLMNELYRFRDREARRQAEKGGRK